MKWRIATDGAGAPWLAEADTCARLLRAPDLPWAESEDGQSCFAYEVPQVRALLVSTYLQAVARLWFKREGHGSIWVPLFVMDICEADASNAVRVVAALVAEASDDEELALVGAGPLEEALAHQGPAIIDEIEHAAARESRFRRALAGVWKSSMADEVWARVTAALGDQPRY